MPFIGLAFSLICLVSLFFIPETTPFLLTRDEFEKARISLVFYNGAEDKTEKKVTFHPDADVAETKMSNSITLDDFRELIAYRHISSKQHCLIYNMFPQVMRLLVKA